MTSVYTITHASLGFTLGVITAVDVAAAAAVCLEKHVHNIVPDKLWGQALAAGPIAQMRVLRLFRHVQKWDRLEYLLRAFTESEVKPEFILVEVEDWNRRFNRTFTTPAAGKRATLDALLVQTRNRIPASELSLIEFSLRL